MKKLVIATSALVASASASFAGCNNLPGIPCNDVPEISALQGTAALAAVAAVVLLAWERRRRAA
ncbi:VPEID-CTERM sorting domain-containing protein [Algirhabdus cladophorae]|uniref:VPEID-CTERM sorting domain-containing protein n=1 Tax=Algirhabdus cladophorae TaxID=3377108 RepID=UPI003B84AAD9